MDPITEKSSRLKSHAGDTFNRGPCPHCGFGESYSLTDGRGKCKLCKSKFLGRPRKTRISPGHLTQIARAFWHFTTAETGAASIGINRKTMQHHYMLIRSHLSKQRERILNRELGDHVLNVSRLEEKMRRKVFVIMALLLRHNEVRVLFPREGVQQRATEVIPDCWICTTDQRAFENIAIDKLSVIASHDTVERREKGERFWRYTRERLRKYRGGFRKNFRLFIREMEFRFNSSDSEGYTRLLDLLPDSRNKTSWEDL